MLGVPDMAQVQAAPREEDWGLNRAQQWDLKWCLRPHTCFLTGRQLWMKRAYRGIRWIHGPGEPVEEIYWVDKDQFLLWHLTKKA